MYIYIYIFVYGIFQTSIPPRACSPRTRFETGQSPQDSHGGTVTSDKRCISVW